MQNKTCPTELALSDYCLGRLPVRAMDEIERHLDGCTQCQTVIQSLDGKSDTLVAELRARAEADPFSQEPNLAEALAAVRQIPQAPSPPAKAAEPPFDPYYTWLGIPPGEQPPHHYRLLGLNPFETNPTVIDHAADRQMAHLRTFQSGKRASDSQRLLNEISRARVCLLNAGKKAEYDRELRQRLVSQQAPPNAAPANASPVGTPETLDELIQFLVASRLATAAEVQQFVAQLPAGARPQDARTLAQELVRARRLTSFQAQELLAGRYRQLIIGERELLAAIGAGGMGQVYRARHRRLDRIEAVKIISTKRLDSADALARFEIEARAAARLSHPNIVATYDAGKLDDVCFIAMEFVDGEDLSKSVKAHGPFSVAEAVDCIRQAAQGLAVAHRSGIIHRDIKPHNLLRDRQGSVKILDLGLARLVNSAQRTDDDGLTKSGQIMGTLDYMSPEQALDTRNADARSDLYSLGCTLFFLLTGRAPFVGETTVAKLLAHRETPTPSLCTYRADVPAELDAIFQQTLAKNPDDRFQTAEELAAALSQVNLAAVPAEAPSVESNSSWSQLLNSFSVATLARPRNVQEAPQPGRTTKTRARGVRSSIRRPTAAVLTALAGLGIFAIAGIIYLLQTPQGIVEVELDEGVADTVSVSLARGGKQVEVVDQGDHWKVTLREGIYEVKLVGGDERLQVDKQTVTIAKGKKQLVRVSVRAENPKATPFPAEISEIRIFKGHEGGVSRGVSFSSDGMWVVSGSTDKTVRLWDVSTGQELKCFRGHTDEVSCVAFSPDRRYVVSQGWGKDTTVRVWDIATGKEVHRFSHDREGCGVCFSPDSKRIVSSSFDGHLRIWDVETEKLLASPLVGKWLLRVAYSPDSHSVLCGVWDGSVQMFDAETGKLLHKFTGPKGITESVGYSKDGRYVLSAGQDCIIRIWDPETEKEMHRFQGPEQLAVTAAFSPDGKYVLSGGFDKTVRLWRVEDQQEVQRFEKHNAAVRSVAFSPDGRRAISGSDDGTLRLWQLPLDAGTGDHNPPAFPLEIGEVRIFKGHEGGVGRGVSFSSDGTWVVSGSSDKTVRLWEVATGQELKCFRGHTEGVSCVAFSPDQRYIVSQGWGKDFTVRVWSIITGKEIHRFSHDREGCGVCFSPDSQRIVSSSFDGHLRIWDVETEKLLASPLVGQWLLRVAYSPDSRSVLCGVWDGSVHMYDAETGKLLHKFTGPKGITESVGYSKDGRYVLACGEDGIIRTWDPETEKEMHRFQGHGHMARSAAFSPDGKYVLSGGNDKTVRLWRVEDQREVQRFEKHNDVVESVAFSPDGRRAISGSIDGTMRLWQLPLGAGTGDR